MASRHHRTTDRAASPRIRSRRVRCRAERCAAGGTAPHAAASDQRSAQASPDAPGHCMSAGEAVAGSGKSVSGVCGESNRRSVVVLRVWFGVSLTVRCTQRVLPRSTLYYAKYRRYRARSRPCASQLKLCTSSLGPARRVLSVGVSGISVKLTYRACVTSNVQTGCLKCHH